MNQQLFKLIHGDWYEDQKKHNKDNYDEYMITFNEESKKYGLKHVTLYIEYFDSGYTAEEIIDKIKSNIARKDWMLSDYVYKELPYLSNNIELKEDFSSIICITKKD